jgi:hypothetical protein
MDPVQHGLAPVALSEWRVEEDCGQGLLLSFTNIPPQNAKEAALRLKQAISGTGKRVQGA